VIPIDGCSVRAAHNWSTADLALAAGAGVTVNRFETDRGSRPSTVEKLRSAMEAGGLVFIPESKEGVGVRLREPGLRK
jgi:hypothetical protein